jgi:DNA-binding PadR family transcriptional regulator
MGSKAILGEFEHVVLATAVSLGDDAYGAELIREIEKRTGRSVTSGSLYVTLDRLEDKGLIRSRMGDPDPRRGGRPKRFAIPTPEGMRALKEVRATMLNLWSGIEDELERV